ncbi:MAG TPA: DUF1028 domain-containing protein [Ignavibacteria bacterium]|nr:DUF1028 domain-containing protein [Ignavibacteria bacterium]HMR39961.1 DUF1028 domain-containing protein [Ignavibacteria bacterium]
MKKYLLLLFILIFNQNYTEAQDTFSICAVDTITGEVGSAGASCVNDCTILTDVHPGYGVVHTQASWLSANQIYARSLMDLGLPPQAIIDSLVLHDAQNNPTVRQYGIVDLVNGGRVAAYTGVNCLNYKNHITGPTYSIQGNILLGQSILDSMESRFLNTNGTLAQKLMAALQGAKVIGADTRCASWNTSSKSAFLRLARPGDTTGVLTLNIQVLNTPFGVEPIDSLQVLFNNWLTSVNQISASAPEDFYLSQNFPNPFNPSTNFEFGIPETGFVTIKIYDALGNETAILVNERKPAGKYSVTFNGSDLASGIYYCKLETGRFIETKRMVLLK